MPELDLSPEELKTLLENSWAASRYLNILKSLNSEPNLDEFQLLRQMRHQAWLKAAADTFFNKKSTKEITQEWSENVDLILKKAFDLAGLDSETLSLIAMGKLGAGELNLSSDVDLIFVSQSPVEASTIKKVQKFTKLLTLETPASHCFRVDYDLRPGGRLGPLVSSFSQLEGYYWSQGQTWERIAWIRQRQIIGSEDLKKNLNAFRKRFCYRKFVELEIFEKIKKLRGQIRKFYYKKLENEEKEFDLKLGTGGIRDIELYLHANLLIHGGKLPQIQKIKTDEIAWALEENGLVPSKGQSANSFSELASNYWTLRHWEHLVQLIGDEQTHVIKKDQAHLPPDSENFWKEVKTIREFVDNTVQSILGPIEPLTGDFPLALEHQISFLKSKGFSDRATDQVWPEIIKSSTHSRIKNKNEEGRQLFLSETIKHLLKIDHKKDRALELLLDFVKAIRAKSSFYALFSHHPQIMAELANMFSYSPMLSQILVHRPEVLDGFIYRAVSEFSNNGDELFDQLSYRKLLTDLVASKEFMSKENIDGLSLSLTNCADAITEHLLQWLKQEYGHSSLKILKLGKWAGQELGLQSDLDFVFVTEDSPNELDHKIAKRFNTQLTGPFKGGRIYDVDMRLRPSGNAGPLLVSKKRLIEYLQRSAKTWERQSYLRAKLENSKDLQQDIIQKCLNKPILEEEWSELKRILSKLTHPISEKQLNLKYNPGGLIHIEFYCQYYFLKHQLAPVSANTTEMIQQIGEKEASFKAEQLINNYKGLRQMEQWIQLLSQNKGASLKLKSEVLAALSKVKKQDSNLIMKQTRELLDESRVLLQDICPFV